MNKFSFPSLLKASGRVFGIGSLEMFDRVNVSPKYEIPVPGEALFDEMLVKDLVASAAMLTGYSKLGKVDSARQIFEQMTEKDLVCWSAMTSNFAESDRPREALRLFNEMQVSGIKPDLVSMLSGISASVMTLLREVSKDTSISVIVVGSLNRVRDFVNHHTIFCFVFFKENTEELMASVVLSLLGPIIELGKCIYDLSKRQCGFLLCYNKDVHVLRKEANSLCTERDDIKIKLEEKRRDRQLPLKKVEEWKSDANKLVREVEELETQLKEESTCLNGWCPNLSWRYRFGKSVAAKVDKVKELKKKCEGFGDSLTHLPQQPDIELIRRDLMQQNDVAMTIMEHVMKALTDDNIRSIGIHGMGGIGKTTLVDNINNKLVETQFFNKVIKVTVSQIVNEKAIQDTIAERLGLNLIWDNTINGRANNLVERLKEHQRVLIILDDVWSKLEVVDLGIPSEDEHKYCKIIVTTRNQYVCREMGLQKVFAMKPLSDTDSWALFAQKIGDVVSKNPILLSIAESIVGECKGSPLAIVTIGSTLRQEEDKIMWEDALRRLESSEPTELEGIMPQVITSIKFSYDYIKDEEMKLCFLFCCLFPEDYSIGLSELRRYGIGEGFLKVDGNLLQSQVKLEAYIKKLKACNLLLDGEKEGQVKMHDIVRDTAIWIGRKNGQGFVVKSGVGLIDWPQLKEENNVQRISLMQNKIRRLSQSQELPQLRTLLFEVPSSHLEHIEDVFFEGMKALVNLNLGSTKLSRLPSSISCLTNLRTLVLKNDFEELDVSIIGELKRLEILELKKCNFSIEFVQLTNLRVLHMDIPLSSIPANVISKLVHLEELHLSLNYGSKKKDDEFEHCSLVEVTSLKCLTSLQVDVDEVRLLSQDVPFHLNQLRAFCIIIREKDNGHRYFGHGQNLVLEQVLPPVQDWVKNLLKITETLSLESCDHETFRHMGSMASLKELKLYHSESMKHFVNTRDFPLVVDVFGRLEVLSLNGLSNLEKICEGPLPYGFGMNLRNLYVLRCKKLTTLLPFDVLRAMHSLEILTIYHCESMTHIVSTAEAPSSTLEKALENLCSLNLYRMPNLIGICNGPIPSRFLRNLKYLIIHDCESMMHIVSTAEAPSSTLEKALESLHTLVLYDMPNLIGICNGPIPSRFLRNLKQLQFLGCKKFKGVFPWGLALETIEKVWIKGMTGGEAFCDLSSHLIPPNALGTFEELELDDIKQTKKVFHESCPIHPLDSIDGRVLYNLRYMRLTDLPNLQCLFSFRIALLFLPNLSRLKITNCKKLETVIEKENEDETILATQNLLPMLKQIELHNLPKLTGLYSASGVIHLPSLETIYVCNCIKLMQLSLEPDSCPKLRQIKGGKKWFQDLEQEMQEEIVRSRFQALFTVDPK
ncbi:probable disease resistance protein At4g27220 [Aristolochia californica]|uniref:probable disease resistance protein At4g27220 n=1 Tax=Aristolochia californica TaxID=171875 RepID=UPI0035DC9850